MTDQTLPWSVAEGAPARRLEPFTWWTLTR
jgi:hypothetical protein